MQGAVIAECSDCIVPSPLPAGCREEGRSERGCRQDGRQVCVGGVAALGGQGAGTEKRGEEAVQQGERKEV